MKDSYIEKLESLLIGVENFRFDDADVADVNEWKELTARVLKGAIAREKANQEAYELAGSIRDRSERKLTETKLNENQRIVVNDVKQDHENYGIQKFNAIHLAFTTYATGYYKDNLKNDEEFYQVLSTLIAWAQE